MGINMDGLMRNLRYWSRAAGQVVVAVVAIVLGISIVTRVDEIGSVLGISIVTGVDEIGSILLAFCKTMSRYGASYMILVMGLLGLTVVNVHMPFTLSMGSTRKDSFVGMEIMLHLAGLVMTGIIIGAGIFAGKELNGMVAVGSIMLLTVSAALGNLLSWAYLRFGKVTGLVLYVLLIIGGMFGVMILSDMNEAGVLQKWGLPPLAAAGWWLPAIAAAVTADMILVRLYQKEVKKLEVRV